MKGLDGFWAWWKRDKRYVVLCKALLLALLPAVCCIVSAAAEGRNIGEVYLPGSEWNDELFYYKQVENMVRFGYPQGYFGFNESHGLKLSFAAWSPVLVLPWVVWGLLFGWNLMSPVLCNMALMMAAMFVFVWLVKPTWKQMGVLTFLFCLYTLFVRYILSGMPEIICISHLIVFYGLAVSHGRREHPGKLAGLFAIAGLLTLMRPYMLLFLLLPAYYWISAARRRGRMWQGILGSAAVSGAFLVCYALLKHYFGAEYFAPLFFTDWITTFFTAGFREGLLNFLHTLYWKGLDFCAYAIQGIRTGWTSGAFFVGYLVTMAVLIWQTVADGMRLRRSAAEPGPREVLADPDSRKSPAGTGSRDRTDSLRAQFVAEAHLALSFVGMLVALLLMYKLIEGSKHLLTFIAAGIFVVALMETRFFKKAVILGAAFAYLYSYMAVDAYDYQVPYLQKERQAQVEEWRVRFADSLELTRENTPNYENVVIWVFNEQNDSGENMKWQLLYALPEGFGISCCKKEYVLENFDRLNSRYIVAQTGAETAARCETAGLRELARDEDIVLYARY
ncbi:MAG: hypothetical protein NC079_03065 [Clostridium sp.]|nr:hypothetical protein [Acetatifactor muris]MCM1525888.1 hypothetical protein [Bacteroides sp.]MCM1562572.1 hypothetical protein [Clostridium sp.]